MTNAAEREQFNSLIKELVENVENEDYCAADKAIIDLVQRRSHELYIAVGNLTRDVHESITELIDKCGEIVDPGGIQSIANEKVPDARERLGYVMEKTEYASEKTVESIVNIQPLAEEIVTGLAEINKKMQHGSACEQADTDELLKMIEKNASDIQAGLNEAMMAQQHQTLASQVVTKTFNLICDIETKMVALVSVAGASGGQQSSTAKSASNDEPYGPAIGNEDDVVHGQEDVDELLSSLGF